MAPGTTRLVSAFHPHQAARCWRGERDVPDDDSATDVSSANLLPARLHVCRRVLVGRRDRPGLRDDDRHLVACRSGGARVSAGVLRITAPARQCPSRRPCVALATRQTGMGSGRRRLPLGGPPPRPRHRFMTCSQPLRAER